MERSEIGGRGHRPRESGDLDQHAPRITRRYAALDPGYKYSSVVRSRGGAGIQRLDFAGVFLVHEFALELHGRGELVVLRGELLLDQMEFLDGLDPGEMRVDLLDLAPDQLADFPRAAQAGVIRERHAAVLREFF